MNIFRTKPQTPKVQFEVWESEVDAAEKWLTTFNLFQIAFNISALVTLIFTFNSWASSGFPRHDWWMGAMAFVLLVSGRWCGREIKNNQKIIELYKTQQQKD